jgi:hypothetical protein
VRHIYPLLLLLLLLPPLLLLVLLLVLLLLLQLLVGAYSWCLPPIPLLALPCRTFAISSTVKQMKGGALKSICGSQTHGLGGPQNPAVLGLV